MEGAAAIHSVRSEVAEGKGFSEPKFVFCEEAEDDKFFPDCTVPGKTTHLVDLSKRIGDRIRMRNTGNTPIVMHIGANSFVPDSPTYRPLLDKLSDSSIPARVVLIDANPAQKEGLIKNVPKWLNIKESNLEVLNIAMSGTCAEPSLRMYQWNETMVDLVSSSEREEIRAQFEMAGLKKGMSSDRSFIVQKGETVRSNSKLAPLYKAVDAAGNMSSYVKEMAIDCYTSSGLMSKIHADAADLAVLTVDIEGGDIPLLKEWWKDVNFKPTFLRFETDGWDESLAEELSSRGYEVGQQNFIQGRTGYNMVAVLPEV